MEAPNQILTAAQMLAAEEALIAQGVTVQELMERAGRGAADWIWRIAAGRKVTVLCGPGNNGGDGYVIARVLEERGLKVEVVAPMEPKTDAAIAARKAWGGVPVAMAEGDVFVDSLFGTGLTRGLSDDLLALLQHLQASHDFSIAVDIPSGIDSDTGALLTEHLPDNDLTLALGSWKLAHWLMPASPRMGARKLADIGITDVADAAKLAATPAFTAPPRAAHKYSRGMVIVMGGIMEGASVLAARAAQHGGAGYTKLVTSRRPDGLGADIVLDNAPDVWETINDDRLGALLIGPGLGRGDNARQEVQWALRSEQPVVLDADALALISLDDALGGAIATPHEGELAAMCKTFGIEADCKLERVRELQAATGMTILAKGADNILVGDDGETLLFPEASSWLSTAGTGDVLAGLVAGRLAVHGKALNAVQEAVQLHAEAARLAGPAFSASDLIDHIPAAYARFL